MKKKMLFVLILIILLPLLAFTSLDFIVSLSAPLKINKPYLINISDRNNNYIYSEHFEGFGQFVPLSKIAKPAIDSLIVSEDRNFYSHRGFDYKRIASSFIQNILKGRIVSGGSTISQQYARTIFLNNDKTIKRKLNEALITKRLERSLSKDEILEGYLNSAYFGHNIYGIEQASYFFFAKSPSELTLSESALLIGILSAPNIYSPLNDYELAMHKKEQVLKLLLDNSYIDKLSYQDALNEELNFHYKKRYPSLSHHLLYYHDSLKEELSNLGFNEDNVLRKSLDVESSIDMNITRLISNIIDSYSLNSDEQEIAVVIMKPNSGDVLSLVGGIDYNISPFNRASNAYRQTGSAIKPLLYYLALQYGLTPLTVMKSEPTEFYIENIGTYSPSNANNVYANRDINMVEAIANSDNIYATKTTLLIGSNALKNALLDFGAENAINNPTIGLGSNVMSPLILASIYNTFASKGKYYKPRFIKSITTGFKEKYINKSNPKFSLDETDTLILNHLLRSPFDMSLSTYATPSLARYQTEKRFAGKTGSTDFDSWVAGFNPNYTIVVYVGKDNNEPLKSGYLAKRLFVDIANAITNKEQDIFFSPNKMMHPFTLVNASNNSTSFVYYY